jgi:hypothetical protein
MGEEAVSYQPSAISKDGPHSAMVLTFVDEAKESSPI